MQYSDSTNKTGLVEDMAFWLGSNNGTIPANYNANDYKRNLREWYRKTLQWYIEAKSSWKINDTIASTNLSITTRSYQLSLAGGLNMSFLKIDRVEISYDGMTYVKANSMDESSIDKSIDSSTIDNYYSKDEPKYVLRGDYIDIYPIASSVITNGLKIHYTLDIGTFGTGATDVPVIPTVGHRIISKGGAYDYYMSRGVQDKADRLMQMIMADKQEFLKYGQTRNEDNEIILTGKYKNYE